MNFSLIASSEYDIFMLRSFKDRVEMFKLSDEIPAKPDFTYAGTKGQKINLSNQTVIEKIEKRQSSLLAFNDLQDKQSLLRISIKNGFYVAEEFYPVSILSQTDPI